MKSYGCQCCMSEKKVSWAVDSFFVKTRYDNFKAKAADFQEI